MGTIIVGLIVVGIVFFIVRDMLHQKRKGKSIQCGGNCKNCRGCQ